MYGMRAALFGAAGVGGEVEEREKTPPRKTRRVFLVPSPEPRRLRPPAPGELAAGIAAAASWLPVLHRLRRAALRTPVLVSSHGAGAGPAARTPPAEGSGARSHEKTNIPASASKVGSTADRCRLLLP